jgi:peptidoglycan/xylan/chitin deacetylase (PgdA/CDA1 family)
MRRLFYILAISALALSSCAKKSTRIEELKEKYDKFVALTFDDGPSTLTPRILDILEKNDATATFFVIGGQVDATTEPTIRRAVEQGCEIGSHSFTHPYMSKLSKQEQLEQSEQTIAAIEKYAPTPKYFRPPYMDADEVTHSVVPQIFIGGYCPSDWDANVGVEERIKGLLENVEDGLIFILHDFKDNNGTAEALEVVIPELQKQGYALVSVDELFAIKGVEAKKGIIYDRVKE